MSQSARRVISDKIKLLRTKSGLKREELSLKLGMDNSYISKVERYKVNFTIDRLEKIAAFFNIDIKEFFK